MADFDGSLNFDLDFYKKSLTLPSGKLITDLTSCTSSMDGCELWWNVLRLWSINLQHFHNEFLRKSRVFLPRQHAVKEYKEIWWSFLKVHNHSIRHTGSELWLSALASSLSWFISGSRISSWASSFVFRDFSIRSILTFWGLRTGFDGFPYSGHGFFCCYVGSVAATYF